MMKGDGLTTYIHTEDNIVQYFDTKKDAEGNVKLVTYIVIRKYNLPHNGPRFFSCEPQMFHIGDIVQVQLSFVVIPVKGGHQKMLSVLCSLALLDGVKLGFQMEYIRSKVRRDKRMRKLNCVINDTSTTTSTSEGFFKTFSKHSGNFTKNPIPFHQ